MPSVGTDNSILRCCKTDLIAAVCYRIWRSGAKAAIDKKVEPRNILQKMNDSK